MNVKVYTAKQDTVIWQSCINTVMLCMCLSFLPHSVHEVIKTHTYMFLLLSPRVRVLRLAVSWPTQCRNVVVQS